MSSVHLVGELPGLKYFINLSSVRIAFHMEPLKYAIKSFTLTLEKYQKNTKMNLSHPQFNLQ